MEALRTGGLNMVLLIFRWDENFIKVTTTITTVISFTWGSESEYPAARYIQYKMTVPSTLYWLAMRSEREAEYSPPLSG
jgi:hypothetical protein